MHTGNLSATAPRCDLDTEAFAQASMLRTERDPMDRENRESMEEIRLRILRITDDLRVIQRELNCAAMRPPPTPSSWKLSPIHLRWKRFKSSNPPSTRCATSSGSTCKSSPAILKWVRNSAKPCARTHLCEPPK